MAFHIRPITTEDEKQISEHMSTIFRRDEPLSCSLGLADKLTQKSAWTRKNNSKQEFSLVAVDELSNIVGVCLNIFKQRNNPETHFKSTNSELQKIVDFIDYIDKEADVFSKCPDVNGIILIHILSVAPAWRGKGIAKQLLIETRKIANALDAQLLQMDCSSYYSAQLALKLNFCCIYKKKYADYCVDGTPVFLVEQPHEEIGIYVQHTKEQ